MIIYIYICNIGLYWDMINKMIRNGIDSNFWPLREKIKPSILWRSIGVTSGTSRFLPAKISWGKRWFNHWTYGYLLALAIVGVLLMGIQPTIMGICRGYNQQHGETVGHLHIMRQQSLCDILDLLSDSLCSLIYILRGRTAYHYGGTTVTMYSRKSRSRLVLWTNFQPGPPFANSRSRQRIQRLRHSRAQTSVPSSWHGPLEPGSTPLDPACSVPRRPACRRGNSHLLPSCRRCPCRCPSGWLDKMRCQIALAHSCH